MTSNSVIAVLCALSMFPAALRAKDEKLKPEQLIAKHLESIGPAAKMKEIKTRSTAGTAHVEFRIGGQASLNGQGSLVSDGSSIGAVLKFPALEYSGEQFIFDGTDVIVGQVSPGTRSPLGRFLYENGVMLKEGLLFGSLSTSWALLNTGAKQPKLNVSGPKKVGGSSVYEMKYEAKKGRGNVQVWLYFDAETFRHVRSQYKVETAAQQIARIQDSAELDRYTLVEEFGSFTEVDGLTLPHSYKADFTIDSQRGAFLGSWSYTVKDVSHNQPIDRQAFSLK